MSSPAIPGARRRVAIYLRVSTAERGQSVDNQLLPLQETANRLGWDIVVNAA
jgi:DNA invertase Pin-like site-specific DNA recombinase